MHNQREVIETLRSACPQALILVDEPMSRHTTFKVGGPADIMIQPSGTEEAEAAVQMVRRLGEPLFVMGNGSNLVVRDGGIKGVVVLLGERMSRIERKENRLYAQAGAMLSRLSKEAMNAGLKGLTFASGIPGSVGGATVMNAGAYGGQISDVLVRAKVFMDGKIGWMTRGELEMGYRTTTPLRKGGIVLEAEFELQEGDYDELVRETAELNRRRRDKQPLNYPSAGSFFKRPEGFFAGALIEQAGLKGMSVGGAQVSELHAGFIINTGGATASDVIALMERVQDAVYRRSSVMLEPEVRIVGRD